MSLGGAQEIGGVVVTIGADLSGLRAGVAEARQIAAGAGSTTIGATVNQGVTGVNTGAILSSTSGAFGANPMRAEHFRRQGEKEGRAYAEGFSRGQMLGPGDIVGGGSILGDLKSSFGRGSSFGMMSKVLMGGGAIMGLSAAGHILSGAANAVNTAAFGGGDRYERTNQIMSNLPVLGGYWQAGSSLQDAMLKGLGGHTFGEIEAKDIAGSNLAERASNANSTVLQAIKRSKIESGNVGGSYGAILAKNEADRMQAQTWAQAGASPQYINQYLSERGAVNGKEASKFALDARAATQAEMRQTSMVASAYGSQTTIAGNQTQIDRIGGSVGGLAGTASSKLAMEDLQYKNQMESISAMRAQKTFEIGEKYTTRREQIKKQFGETPEANLQMIAAERMRNEENDALQDSIAAIRGETTARHETTRSEIMFASDLQKRSMVGSLGTRQLVAGAVGKGQGMLASTLGRIGGMSQELTAVQNGPHSELANLTRETQIMELQAMKSEMLMPTRYATQSNRGFDAPGGASGHSGEDLAKAIKAIETKMEELKIAIKSVAPLN